MDESKKSRFRMWHIALFAILLAGGVFLAFMYIGLPPHDVRRSRHGMTVGEMKAEFGVPYSSFGDEFDGYRHAYRFDWGDVNLFFRPGEDRCARVFFHYGISTTWYEYHEDGSVTEIKGILRAPL